MRVILAGLAATVLVVAAGGVAAGRDEKDAKVDAKLLVGKWTPKEEDKKGEFYVEFLKDGKLLFTAGGGKDFKVEGTYKLDGNKLRFKLKFGETEKEDTRIIHSLTKTELTSSDDKGKKDTLVRVEDKK
jgi:uncharacterized protein (TIGR03066 family)